MKFLKKWRSDLELSRSKAVRLMKDVSEGTLQYWEEKAKDMSFAAAVEICRAYGKTLLEFEKAREEEFKK